MKLRKKIILGIAIFLFVLLGTTICILYLSQFHLDLSQDYRSVEGYEDIVFKDPKSKQCFRLCAWFGVEIGEERGYECLSRLLDGRMDAVYRDGNILIWIYDYFYNSPTPPAMSKYIYDELGLNYPERSEA